MASSLTVNQIGRAGINLTTLAVAADAAGNYFANAGYEFLYIKNSGASAITITLVAQITIDGSAVVNKTISVGSGKEMLIGPFPIEFYNDGNDRMNVTYSAVTSLTVAACKLYPKA